MAKALAATIADKQIICTFFPKIVRILILIMVAGGMSMEPRLIVNVIEPPTK
jgi:hypothetical protein